MNVDMAGFTTNVILFVMIVVCVVAEPTRTLKHPSDVNSNTSLAGINNVPHNATNNTTMSTKRLRTDHLSKTCSLHLYNESKDFFSNAVLEHQYNFMYLKLRFFNHSHLTDVAATQRVINQYDWIWTYRGEGGAHQYLYLPGDFGYLSFGLLWLETHVEPMNINIKMKGDCSNLTIGTTESDNLIGHVLDSLTSPIASLHVIYNYSYWCYNERMWIWSDFLYSMCRNSICTMQTFEYRCCQYVIHINKTRVVECRTEHHHFGVLWWMLPIIIGETLFAFCPILLTRIGMKFTDWDIQFRKRRHQHTTYSSLKPLCRSGSSTDTDMENRSNFVSLKDRFPISFMSTIFSPIYQWDCSGPVASRVMRLWLIICPVLICATRVCLDYIYAGDLVKGAVEKGALVGFSSLIAGPKIAKEEFLRCFDGPETAITIFLVFSCALVLFPKRLSDCLEQGLPASNDQYIFLLKMPLKLKERFSGISVRKYRGFRRINQLLIAQTFMLLHWKFWRHSIKLFCIRWSNVMMPAISMRRTLFVLSILFRLFLFPLYVIFCIIELVVSVIYFMFPIVNSCFIVLKAFVVEYFTLCQNRSCCLKLIRNLLFAPLVALYFLSWYMYCIIFFDAFWFLSKIAMFTYSGIIAYPKTSYGYMILCLMSLYYMFESANSFGEKYRELLKVSIDVIRKMSEREGECDDNMSTRFDTVVCKHGIDRELFFLIVNRHRPRRNQVMITLLKFVSIITILTVSVELLITFDKFQDLSLVSHVFTVLFVCALPKLIRVMCAHRNHTEPMRRLRAKIKRTVYMYINHRRDCCSDVEHGSETMRTESESTEANDSDDDHDIVYDNI